MRYIPNKHQQVVYQALSKVEIISNNITINSLSRHFFGFGVPRKLSKCRRHVKYTVWAFVPAVFPAIVNQIFVLHILNPGRKDFLPGGFDFLRCDLRYLKDIETFFLFFLTNSAALARGTENPF